MNKEIQKQINNEISLLPVYHQLAFGVMLSERFLPNYFAFHYIEKWGNPMILLNGIDLLKNIIRQESFDPIEIELIDNFIEDATPDMDDFSGSISASLALDCSSMIYECFEFVKNKNIKHIESCSQISFSSLEMYIQVRDKLSYDLSALELNNYFAKDNLINNEIKYQFDLLAELRKDLKINNKLYIEQTINAPNIVLVQAI